MREYLPVREWLKPNPHVMVWNTGMIPYCLFI